MGRLIPLLFCLAGLVRAGEAPAPVEATVFYSAHDPHWKDAEIIIDATGREFPALKITKVSMDDDEGYRKLAETERRLKIAPAGDITAVLGAIFITSRDERRDVEKYFRGVARRMVNPGAVKGRLPADAGKYAAEIFGKEAAFPAESNDSELRCYAVTLGGKRAGWVVDAFAPLGCPQCNDTHFLMAVSSPELRVLDVRPVRELERSGIALDEKEVRAFTARFKGRAPAERGKVDMIQGATKTSQSVENTINLALQELKRREGK